MKDKYCECCGSRLDVVCIVELIDASGVAEYCERCARENGKKVILSSDESSKVEAKVAKPKKIKLDCEAIYKEACGAGKVALKACIPTPMIVAQHKNVLDDSSSIEKAYYVPQGACVFAWVAIDPARGQFVDYLKKNNIGNLAYRGGYQIWVDEGGQSVELKSAYAGGFAEVLRKYGIDAYSDSRLD